MSKICKKCGVKKEFSEFYKHKQMSDGYLSFCKKCVQKRVSEHRENNLEKVREYDRVRGRLSHRLEGNKIRSRDMSDEQKEKKKISIKKWQEKNKLKRSCHCILNNAVKTKKIFKPNKCSCCEKSDCRISGHHKDYTKPLIVAWLCDACHKKLHRKYKITNTTP